MPNSDELLLSLDRAAPYLQEYLGVWCMAEAAFHVQWQAALQLNLAQHLLSSAPAAAEKSAAEQAGVTVSQGVALIPLRGSLMKQVSSLSNNTSTVLARRKVRAAASDPQVKAILLQIESPGGTSAGTAELADDIRAASERKPVEAYIEDLGASAAYWLASQASRITANAAALVGSIGTYAVVYDFQGAAAQAGIKAHVVRAGALKGAFTPGTEITAEQLADLQRIVSQTNDFFLSAVSAGRKLPRTQVESLADGRLHLAADAKTLQLIDAVDSMENVFARLASLGSKRMSETPGGAPQAATLAQLKAVCPAAGADFWMAQLEAGATVEQAQRAYAQQLHEANQKLLAEREALTKQLAEADAKAKAALPSGTLGAPPKGDGGQAKLTADDAQAEIEELIAAHQTSHPGVSRAMAYRHVMRNRDDLRQALVQQGAA